MSNDKYQGSSSPPHPNINYWYLPFVFRRTHQFLPIPTSPTDICHLPFLPLATPRA
jgi:hypothetical protein